MNKDKLDEGFTAWLAEPSGDGGKQNGHHLNTRTTDCCEVAFKAGVEWAEQNRPIETWRGE